MYSTASLSIAASSNTDFSLPNADFIIDHEPGSQSVLELDRVSFQNNHISAVRSTALVAIRNCPGLTADSGVDVMSGSLLDCTSSEVGAYCSSPDYCTNALFGIDCYCFPDGEKTDPLVGSCLGPPRIYVPERDLTIVGAKPNTAVATLLFVNKGGEDITFDLKQIGTTAPLWWNVTPSSGILTKDDPVATIMLTLDSTQLQARAKAHTTAFSLLSNSAEDSNITISADLLLSADPVASLSNVTLDNSRDVVAGGTLSFHLTLIDFAQLVIMDASGVAYSAALVHPVSNTSVQCGVSYDIIAGRQEGGCSLPDLVCNKDADADECKFSPPTGEFILKVADSDGSAVGAKSYAFDVTGCPSDYYESDAKCLRCPKNVACAAGSLISDWQLDPGYWRASDNAAQVHECRFGVLSCPGDGANQGQLERDRYCASEYVGPLCSQCDEDHFLSWVADGKCHECSDDEQRHAPTISLFTGIAVLGAALVFSLRKCRVWKNGASSSKSDFFATMNKLYVLAKAKIFTLFLASQVRWSHYHSLFDGRILDDLLVIDFVDPPP